ncbi:hypothetical protein ASE35_05715 [Lysobacter sp. Root916]|uniref:hypothetical protein n=1 Tax=Lysobacter sp. Root916 TaxID=1736606 RepID=UPI00070CFBDD|nr:hypothetical protein [Lysobacter sp. Root916]KRD39818.1 hypothetical protein ASE35_05715 [Lysobacter sp. Root916]
MSWVTNISSFKDFLSLVIVHAPDDFPQEDFLKLHEQLSLESAFHELSHGLTLMAQSGVSANAITNLADLLEKSLASYRSGDDIAGAHLLQELESQAFGSPHAP